MQQNGMSESAYYHLSIPCGIVNELDIVLKMYTFTIWLRKQFKERILEDNATDKNLMMA